MTAELLKQFECSYRDVPEQASSKDWDEYFKLLKIKNVPTGKMYMRSHFVSGVDCFHKTGENYDGETAYERYCKFINSVLNTIRNGGVDFCYYIYQIVDLLKYEPEKLSVTWKPDDRYFLVKLD